MSVEFASFDGYPLHLQCPLCGDEYLHHTHVTIYHRGEDDPQTLRTVVSGGHITSSPHPSWTVRNPSSRRDGLAIAFWCENCGKTNELTFAQHKGCTHVEWRTAANAKASETWESGL